MSPRRPTPRRIRVSSVEPGEFPPNDPTSRRGTPTCAVEMGPNPGGTWATEFLLQEEVDRLIADLSPFGSGPTIDALDDSVSA
ncbi:hypothetical protein [Streptomyces sp. SID3343]|uniref:hypothetical protein n=1 Tax=Streptomyces sp. SID3343 TaxID=2690260 RepID=UPI0013686E3A|nr:hypothetical protein [Streptomyces sp. SID3343]MYW02333.1 hypothetical protein [Streptomyces sp. SID3343]